MLLDLPALLEPASPACPAGADLEYTAVAELDRLAGGQAANIDPATGQAQAPAEPDWHAVATRADALLRSTKDLRVAVWLVHAALVVDGLPGLGQALALLAGLLEAFWPSLHPAIAPEDDGGALERLNVLANLSPDPAQSHPCARAEAFQRALRQAVVAESRQAGRYAVRDLASAPPSAVERACTTGDAAQHARRAEGVRLSLEALVRIQAVFSRHGAPAPRLVLLRQVLERVGRVYGARGFASNDEHVLSSTPTQSTPSTPSPESLSNVGAPGHTAPALPTHAAALSTRDDALASLAGVAAWVRSAEPSSPAPLLIDQAIALMQMDFGDIVRTLMPGAGPHVALLTDPAVTGADARAKTAR